MNDSEEQMENKQRLLDTIDDRRPQYDGAFIGLAVKREDRPSLKYSIVRFLHESEGEPETGIYDYGSIVIAAHVVEVDKAVSFISRLLDTSTAAIEGTESDVIDLQIGETEHIDSDGRYGRFVYDWPVMHCELRTGDGPIGGAFPTKIDLPFYPHYVDAIRDLLELAPEANPYNIDIFMPDFRARLVQVRIDGQQILVDVDTLEAAEDGIRVKLFIRYEEDTGTSGNLTVKDGTAEYLAPKRPESVDIALMSSAGDKIDRRSFSLTGAPSDDVVILDSQREVLQLIERGEGPNVEYKRTLDTSKEGEYLETIAAFANTDGGFLLVGVDDNARVCGWSGDAERVLRDRIGDLCDPIPEIAVTEDIYIEGQPVTLVGVPKGKERPYILKNRGIMIRVGASDRQVKRRELDRMYEERGSHLVGMGTYRTSGW